MAIFNSVNKSAKTEINSGFGNNAGNNGGRFIKKDGTPNVTRVGISYFKQISSFHTLMGLPIWKFLLFILFSAVLLNIIFAFIYLIIGVDHLTGVHYNTVPLQFLECFFFSVQTFTTVGYGRVAPIGMLTSSIAAFEAFFGLLSFAIATGLLYARFSKPTAYLMFSDNFVIAPFEGGFGLMFRLVPYKNVTLTEAEAKVTIALMEDDGKGNMVNQFYPVELEYSKVNALTLSWTIVHPIDEKSPFYKFTLEDFAKASGEVIVFVKAFDDTFSNLVVARTSYTFDEMRIGEKFVPMYHKSKDATSTIVDVSKLNDRKKVPFNI
jgi:inward rectifier potassium channel